MKPRPDINQISINSIHYSNAACSSDKKGQTKFNIKSSKENMVFIYGKMHKYYND
jgi:hypothetical protein